MSVRERSSRRPRRLTGSLWRVASSEWRVGTRSSASAALVPDRNDRSCGRAAARPYEYATRCSLSSRSRREIVALEDSVEDAVDELRRLDGPELFRDLDG